MGEGAAVAVGEEAAVVVGVSGVAAEAAGADSVVADEEVAADLGAEAGVATDGLAVTLRILSSRLLDSPKETRRSFNGLIIHCFNISFTNRFHGNFPIISVWGSRNACCFLYVQ